MKVDRTPDDYDLDKMASSTPDYAYSTTDRQKHDRHLRHNHKDRRDYANMESHDYEIGQSSKFVPKHLRTKNSDDKNVPTNMKRSHYLADS